MTTDRKWTLKDRYTAVASTGEVIQIENDRTLSFSNLGTKRKIGCDWLVNNRVAISVEPWFSDRTLGLNWVELIDVLTEGLACLGLGCELESYTEEGNSLLARYRLIKGLQSGS